MAASDTTADARHRAVQTPPTSVLSSWHKTLIPFAAGAIGGSVAATVLSPLDIVRTRMQSATFAARHASPMSIFLNIVRNEGPVALYRGLMPTILGVGPSRALYFGSYAIAKRSFAGEGYALNGKILDIVSASAAGVFSNTIMSPWWVIRLRLQLQETPIDPVWTRLNRWWQKTFHARVPDVAATVAAAHSLQSSAQALPSTASAAVTDGYKGVIDCARRMYREEGWRSFYRGLTASYLGVIETAVQFTIYGEFKRAAIEARIPEVRARYAAVGIVPTDDTLRREAYSDSLAFTASALSKLVAAALTYPHEVLRTRMREQRSGNIKYGSILQTAKLIMKEEGVKGLYGGMSVHMLRTVPNAAILLLVVEKLVGGSL